MGFIGGQLSIVGGYSWPGGVSLVEQWDEDLEEWVNELQRMRYNFKRIHNVPVSDHDLLTHVMNYLPRKYDTLIKSFERQIGSMSSKFSIEKMKD